MFVGIVEGLRRGWVPAALSTAVEERVPSQLCGKGTWASDNDDPSATVSSGSTPLGDGPHGDGIDASRGLSCGGTAFNGHPVSDRCDEDSTRTSG